VNIQSPSCLFLDANTNDPYCGIDHIEEGQQKFNIYNSLLSEFGGVGFEYGLPCHRLMR